MFLYCLAEDEKRISFATNFRLCLPLYLFFFLTKQSSFMLLQIRPAKKLGEVGGHLGRQNLWGKKSESGNKVHPS